MGLIARVMGTESPKLGPDQVSGCICEVLSTRMTVDQMATGLGLSAAEKVEAAAIVDRIAGNYITCEQIHMLFALSEAFIIPLNTEAAIKARIGI